MTQILLLTLILAMPLPPLSTHYESARKYGAANATFHPPNDLQRTSMTELVKVIIAGLAPGAPPKALVDRAGQSGFDLSLATDRAGEIWTLREAGARRDGGGLYAFRAKGLPVCIQAPHTFFDKGTGTIALDLFTQTRAACLFTNTIHRHTPGPGDHPADVAHAPRTFFMAAHEAIVAATKWDFVQIHGFGPKDKIGDEVAAIVSDGQLSRPATAPIVRFRNALATRLPRHKALLFGEDADRLGATTNIQGQRARTAGRTFIHVELSAAARKEFSTNGAKDLAMALKETLGSR